MNRYISVFLLGLCFTASCRPAEEHAPIAPTPPKVWTATKPAIAAPVALPTTQKSVTITPLPATVPTVTLPTTVPTGALPALHVNGNRLETLDGKPVWLQGLCVDSMQWGTGENILKSIPVAIEQWHANVIRLPITDAGWNGKGKNQGKDPTGLAYRALVDSAIQAANTRGAYLVLDLHRFGSPTPEHVEFWKDAAVRYKNHPGVMFEIFNEPHGAPWPIWRNGGSLGATTKIAGEVKESNEATTRPTTPGMQAIVKAIRDQGANNVIIAGVLGYSYSLIGIDDYKLTDTPEGHGIVYSVHVYPWKGKWQANFIDAAAKYPLFVGEVGAPGKWEDVPFIQKNARKEKLGPDSTWPADIISVIQKYKLNWTGFSFHPKCMPQAISDWNYTPTPYWGVYVKRALGGEQFTSTKLR